eukprot:gnl/TRDRNA2_/TRDRNA2_83036_c0_seq1.p1 gnl/TRDRNA2_/TRDRNA2_83036_c0~~gnl/TRDRNA2_/TRDRNA2_83036_c0_seq1.p1  ORF type:complete len:241 (-),score=32.38 gnl/TRDRNA2_/TRDRNA2_83036_c0_seq1:98-757(-)
MREKREIDPERIGGGEIECSVAPPPGMYQMDNGGRDKYHGDDGFEPCDVQDVRIDPSRDCFPRCIVWTIFPFCSACLPFVGHMGIGNSRGEVFEFMGGGAFRAPQGGLSFFPVTRYVQLSPRLVRRGTWDEAILTTIRKYKGVGHGACVSNCHTFVAECLAEMRYAGFPCWGWVYMSLAVWIFFFGRFATMPRCAIFFFPSVLAITVMYFLFSGKIAGG